MTASNTKAPEGAGYPEDVMKAAVDAWEANPNAGVITIISRALMAERSRSQWQDIATAPMNWTDVVLYDPEYRNDWRKVFEGYYDFDKSLWLSAQGEPVNPTHWQPLPAAPKAES